MRLPDGMRQVVAGVLAAGAFLGLYFGLLLQWWLSGGLAAAVYFALLLVIARRTPLSELMLSDRVSAADVAAAGAALAEAVNRVGHAAGTAPDADRPGLAELQSHLASIREQVLADPADYRSAQRFITSYLPRMVDSVEGFAALARRVQGPDVARLQPLREGLATYREAVARIDRACLENDFTALEAEIDALAFQVKRG